MRAVVVRWARLGGVAPGVEVLNAVARVGSARLQEDDRRRIVGVRLLLLLALRELGQADDVELRQTCDHCGGEHGRPVVTIGGRTGPHVSFAHAGDVAVVAIGPVPVGIDVEPIDAPIDDVHAWTRTEAVLKATGHGLDVDPGLVDVSATRLEAWRGPGRQPVVRVRAVESIPRHAAALAMAGRPSRPVDVGERALRPA